MRGGGWIPRGRGWLTRREPRREIIKGADDAVALDFVLPSLQRDVDRRVFCRPDGEGAVKALTIVEVKISATGALLVQGLEAECGPVFLQHDIRVNGAAEGAPAIGLHRDPLGWAGQMGAVAGDVDVSAGATVAEKNGVGPERKIDAADVVGVIVPIEIEKIERLGTAETADTDVGIVATKALGRGRENIGVVAVFMVDLDVEGVVGEAGEMGAVDVVEKVFREHRHTGGDIAEIGDEAPAGEALFRGVAGIFRGIYREYFECDDVNFGDRGRLRVGCRPGRNDLGRGGRADRHRKKTASEEPPAGEGCAARVARVKNVGRVHWVRGDQLR